MKRLVALFILVTVLSGCGASDVFTGPVVLPEKQDGNKHELTTSLTEVHFIYVEYHNNKTRELSVAKLDFANKGIIRGSQSPLVPLSETKSELEVLGISTELSTTGTKAQLFYNEHAVVFEERVARLFKDSDNGVDFVDAPKYMNGTLYIPLIPLLDVLSIQYRIQGSDLIIGGLPI